MSLLSNFRTDRWSEERETAIESSQRGILHEVLAASPIYAKVTEGTTNMPHEWEANATHRSRSNEVTVRKYGTSVVCRMFFRLFGA